MSIEFLKELREKRTTYKDMIDFCCDSLVLNNDIINELTKHGFYFDTFCGVDYDEELDEYTEVYQYYIINKQDANRLAEYTNELVIYNYGLDLYLLCVTHWGSSWGYVPSNWKNLEDMAD